MDKPKTTAKDFFLWAGVIVSFYWSVLAYAGLVFDYIDYTFPNALSYYPLNPYESGISFEMASIIVLFPIYILLMWIIRREYAIDPTRKEIWARRWALILTLFLAGIAMAGDLITLVATFLNGSEMTSSFLLKVLFIFLLAAGVFMHFISDLRGYWDRFPQRQNAVRIGVAVLAVATVIAGFFIVGTPWQARMARFDNNRVSDLQEIQYRVVDYYQAKQELPSEISELANSLSYGALPTDPATNAPYIYKMTSDTSFQLCATFSAPSHKNPTIDDGPVPGTYGVVEANWDHGIGQVCFDRTIDPSYYSSPYDGKM